MSLFITISDWMTLYISHTNNAWITFISALTFNGHETASVTYAWMPLYQQYSLTRVSLYTCISFIYLRVDGMDIRCSDAPQICIVQVGVHAVVEGVGVIDLQLPLEHCPGVGLVYGPYITNGVSNRQTAEWHITTIDIQCINIFLMSIVTSYQSWTNLSNNLVSLLHSIVNGYFDFVVFFFNELILCLYSDKDVKCKCNVMLPIKENADFILNSRANLIS